MKKIKCNGFTLIEILLVIGVIMIMSIIKIRDINEETENLQSKMLASQIKTVADATNAFLVLKYSELSTLSVSGCNSSNQTCSITLQQLNDEDLLPPNFATTTILGQPYQIQLKRTGNAPNYMISGIVLTKGTKANNATPSRVFMGKVLKEIGREGGLNKDKGNITGTAGGWSADSNLFPILSEKVNYIGSAVGSLSGAYYVYLRRDGTLPMTGDLNMDGHNIYNVKNLTATGALTTTGDISGKDINATGNISVSGAANVNTLESTGRATVGEFIQLNGQATVGATCSPNGLQGRTSAGEHVSCINGVWSKLSLTGSLYSVRFDATTAGSGDVFKTLNLGQHLFCVFSGDQTTIGMVKHSRVYQKGADWILEMRVIKWESSNSWAYATCYD
ncbi:hypothetical protein [Klebsiella aerogenes]|uniref:hypothetical protein n=1 Tax=Klebsiella aerogenes TaxID=548 RepID=UPI002175F8E4|nr:hypothetical protein [Klebsiella aerogenes]UWC50062.1 hypothetical protein M5S98_28615 [Klebsiella aerogenes]HCJ5312678.1 hypothetical protein [Klebsiella aerogenes]